MKSAFILILIAFQILLINSKEKITFDKLLADLKKDAKMKKMAIAGADIPETLKTSRLAKDMKIGDSILIGDEVKIKRMAKEENIDISDFKIVNLIDNAEISRYACKLVHDGEADMYVKGSIETREVLKAIFDNEIAASSSISAAARKAHTRCLAYQTAGKGH